VDCSKAIPSDSDQTVAATDRKNEVGLPDRDQTAAGTDGLTKKGNTHLRFELHMTTIKLSLQQTRRWMAQRQFHLTAIKLSLQQIYCSKPLPTSSRSSKETRPTESASVRKAASMKPFSDAQQSQAKVIAVKLSYG